MSEKAMIKLVAARVNVSIYLQQYLSIFLTKFYNNIWVQLERFHRELSIDNNNLMERLFLFGRWINY
jgi:hypothetical protein